MVHLSHKTGYSLIFVILLLSITTGFTAIAQNDTKAKALLDEVSAKAKNYDNISIDFKYVLENTEEIIGFASFVLTIFLLILLF